ncbi:MAG: multiheme c-type cytochrome [Candidatus Sumerlaeaceae bacterium]
MFRRAFLEVRNERISWLLILLIGQFSAIPASPNPNVEAIDSPLARSTASTTTETRPYVATVPSTSSLTLLYSASRGSKLEPCGCRALNLGGFDREAAMLQTVQALSSATLIFDSGGFFREFTDENLRLQGYYLVEALNHAGIHAMNVGYHDLRQGLGNLLKLRDQLGLPLISANIVDARTRAPIFDPYKLVTLQRANGKPLRVAIVGVTASSYAPAQMEGEPKKPISQIDLRAKWTIAPRPELNERGGAAEMPRTGGSSPALEYAFSPTTATLSTPYEIVDVSGALKPLVEKLRPECDVLVLASFATWDRTRAVVEAVPGIDIAVAGEFMRHYEPQRFGPSQTLLVATDHDGKYLGQVDVELDESAHIRDAAAQLHPILQSIQPDSRFTQYIAAYSRDTQALPTPQTPQLAEKVYAGATSCRTCHADAFAQWKTHHHSRAMKALVDKGMQYNVDCLRCHTVAFKQPGGFTDLRVTPGLANVQCEVCHGPAQNHVLEQNKLALEASSGTGAVPAGGTARLQMEWDAKFCMQCHDSQNDPQFNFEQDIKRVRHKDPAPARVRSTTATLAM